MAQHGRLAITVDTYENIKIIFYSNSSESAKAATCKTSWQSSVYKGICDVPNVGIAGMWTIKVTLNGASIYLGKALVACPTTFFSDRDFKCRPCPRGVVCTESGVVLSALPIEEGFWRSSSTSYQIYKCKRFGKLACRGARSPIANGTSFASSIPGTS